MASAPIILVPGFWLGAWAWDEVAGLLRADGHDVTALTLPGLESKEPTDRRSRSRTRRRDRRCDPGRAGAGRPRDPQRDRVLRLRRQRRRPGPDRGDGLRRHRPGEGRARSLVRRRREADGVGGGQGGGEPRRAERGAARHVPRAGRAGAREPHPRGARAHERRPDGHSGDDHRDRLHVRGVPGGRPEHPDWAFLAGLGELRNVTWIDLPTSHWPMWSRPADVARIIGDVATRAGDAG